MGDIEKSFTFLHDNLPRWLQNVADIEEKIVALQSELSKIPVSRSLPFRKRTGSVESIRDLDAIREESDAPATKAHHNEPSARKRKDPSLLSGQQSGPSKLRSRTMIVVNYDGQIQTSFEHLVRAIGTGRNMLRKGKMAAKMDAMAAMAASSSDDDDDDDDESTAVMAKIGYRHRGLPSVRARGMMRMMETTSSTPAERFDTADKALEEAQALCERAAHQSLREGDCRKELGGVRRYFNEVAELAKTEVAQYGTQRLIADDKAQQQDLRQGPTPERQILLPNLEKGLIPNIMPPALSTNNPSKVIDIEIDDEESDDGNHFTPPLRLTSRV